MDSSVSLKDQIWFLCVCHHVSNVLYYEWQEVRQLQLFLRMAWGYMVTVMTANGTRLDGYSYYYDWHELRWLQLFLRMT